MGHTYTSCQKCLSVNKVKTEKIENSNAICGKCGENLVFHKFVSDVDENSLIKILSNSDIPVVIDFWAPWCGPCKSFAPTFETASEFEKGKKVFIKINTEKYPNISEQFNIRGIPTLVAYKNGKEIKRESGAFPLEHFKNWLSQIS